MSDESDRRTDPAGRSDEYRTDQPDERPDRRSDEYRTDQPDERPDRRSDEYRTDQPDERPDGRPADSPDESASRIDRRGVLRSIAGGAYVLGLARALDVDDFLSPPGGTVSVDAAHVRRDPTDPGSLEPTSLEVPADWHAAVTSAFELHDRLISLAIPGYFGSAVVPGSLDDASARVSVRVDPEDVDEATKRLRSYLSGVVDDPASLLDRTGSGVDLDVREIEAVQKLEAEPAVQGDPNLYVADGIDDGIPGGVSCETERSNATLAPAIYRADGGADEPLFATASHAYRGVGEATGEPLFLPREEGDPVELGRVETRYPVADLALVEPARDRPPASRIQGEIEQRVVGQYTRLGLAVLAARGDDLEKVGARTTRTSGAIEGIDAATCLTGRRCRRGQLAWGEETDMSDGDSGSVSYRPEPDLADDGVLVASVNNARTWWPGQNFVWGIAAYELADRYGLHF